MAELTLGRRRARWQLAAELHLLSIFRWSGLTEAVYLRTRIEPVTRRRTLRACLIKIPSPSLSLNQGYAREQTQTKATTMPRIISAASQTGIPRSSTFGQNGSQGKGFLFILMPVPDSLTRETNSWPVLWLVLLEAISRGTPNRLSSTYCLSGWRSWTIRHARRWIA
jgi:hypothetical protein